MIKILKPALFGAIFVASILLSVALTILINDGLWNEHVDREVKGAKETAFIDGYYMAGYTWCMFDLANNGKSPWVYSNPNAQEYCITFERTLFLEETHKMTPPVGYDSGKIKRGGRTG